VHSNGSSGLPRPHIRNIEQTRQRPTDRRRRGPPTGRWHLDEMVVKIAGRRMYLWRAVDDEGEVLDVLV
jgi:transposase-like protein